MQKSCKLVIVAAWVAAGLAACKMGPEPKPQLSLKSTPAAPTYRDVVLADQPMAYYEFNETVGVTLKDSSASGRHPATCKGGVMLGQPSAHASLGKAALMDGTDGRVVVPANPDFKAIGGGAFSIEFWFKAHSSSRGDLINYKLEEGERDFGIFSCWETEGQVSQYDATEHHVKTDQVPINTWHHVVVTRSDGGEIVLYVDGDKRDAGTSVMSWDFDADLLMGCNHLEGDSDSINFVYTGLMDEMAIYKTALPAVRVLAHYQAGRPEGVKKK